MTGDEKHSRRRVDIGQRPFRSLCAGAAAWQSDSPRVSSFDSLTRDPKTDGFRGLQLIARLRHAVLQFAAASPAAAARPAALAPLTALVSDCSESRSPPSTRRQRCCIQQSGGRVRSLHTQRTARAQALTPLKQARLCHHQHLPQAVPVRLHARPTASPLAAKGQQIGWSRPSSARSCTAACAASAPSVK